MRPGRPPVPIVENITAELKCSWRWLPWRYADRPNQAGRFGKVPHGRDSLAAPPSGIASKFAHLPVFSTCRYKLYAFRSISPGSLCGRPLL